MGVFMVLPAWLLLMLPQLLAGIGQLVGSAGAVQRQNKYNSPFQQIKRLREAGLPFAAYQAGQAGNQSQLPSMDGFATLGNAAGVALGQGNQLKQFREILRKLIADADVSENAKALSDADRNFDLMNGIVRDGELVTNRTLKNEYNLQISEFAALSAKKKSEMENIDQLIKEARYADGSLLKQAEAEYDKLVKGNALLQQVWESNDARTKSFKKIIDLMEGADGELGFVEALLVQLISALSGGFSGEK